MLGALALSAAGKAAVVDDSRGPYQGIVERNVFNLKPRAPDVAPEPPAPPPPKIKLNGIFTILGKKQTGLTVSIPPRPPDPAREESFILVEGQRKGDIEVLQISEAGGMVKVNNHGTIQFLNFTNDGPRLAAAPPPIPSPGAPPMPASMNPNPGALPPGVAPSAIRTIPTRTMRLPQVPGGAQPVSPNAQMPPPGGYPVSYPAAVQPTGAPSPENQLSPEEQAIIIEAQRQKYQQDGNPIANILPPTRLTPKNGGPPIPPQ